MCGIVLIISAILSIYYLIYLWWVDDYWTCIIHVYWVFVFFLQLWSLVYIYYPLNWLSPPPFFFFEKRIQLQFTTVKGLYWSFWFNLKNVWFWFWLKFKSHIVAYIDLLGKFGWLAFSNLVVYTLNLYQ